MAGRPSHESARAVSNERNCIPGALIGTSQPPAAISERFLILRAMEPKKTSFRIRDMLASWNRTFAGMERQGSFCGAFSVASQATASAFCSKGLSRNNRYAVRGREQYVVPVAVEVVKPDIQGVHLRLADLDGGRVVVRVPVRATIGRPLSTTSARCMRWDR